MENENQRCYRCKFFERYYFKGNKRYNKTKFGWCRCANRNVKATDGCENYCYKSVKKGGRFLLRNCLNDLLTEISEIRKLIEDDFDETDEDLQEL